jgi:hypothetical protein
MDGHGTRLAPTSKVRAIQGLSGLPRAISVAVMTGEPAGARVVVGAGVLVDVVVGDGVAVEVEVDVAVAVGVQVAVGRGVGVGVGLGGTN